MKIFQNQKSQQMKKLTNQNAKNFEFLNKPIRFFAFRNNSFLIGFFWKLMLLTIFEVILGIKNQIFEKFLKKKICDYCKFFSQI